MRKTSIHSLFKAFTLIELIVVITIISIISLATYMPYAHHQKKVLLKQSAKEISQSIVQSRNLALNGLNTGWGNVNVGLYFDREAQDLIYYASTGALTISTLNSDDIYMQKSLPAWVQVDSIAWKHEKTLFTFSSIFGTGSISQEVSWAIADDVIDINISYKGASSSVLQKTIHYYRKSHISEY